MGNFRRGNDRQGFGRGGSFGRNSSFGGRSRGGFSERSGGRGRDFGDSARRGPVEMHDAVCSKCGKKCQVPFRPTGSKPVFCSDCFDKDGSGQRNSFGHDNSNASSEKLNEINLKLDKIIKHLKLE